MNALGLALTWLAAAAPVAIEPPALQTPSLPLRIESCVGVDDATVRRLLEVELRAPAIAVRPSAIIVRCVEATQQIRVEPWAIRDPRGVRTVVLPAFDKADAAAREARTRELALGIAEMVRRLQSVAIAPTAEASGASGAPGSAVAVSSPAAPAPRAANEPPTAALGGAAPVAPAAGTATPAQPIAQPAASTAVAPAIGKAEPTTEPAPVTPAAPPPPVVAATTASPERSDSDAATPGPPRLGLGVTSSLDAFTGGRNLAGGEVSALVPLWRSLVGEVALGGRLGGDDTLPAARLETRALVATIGLGLAYWSRHNALGLALLLHAREYVVQFRVVDSTDGGARAATLAATVLSLEPRVMVALHGNVYGVAAAGVGAPVRGIRVRDQGAEAASLTGVALSGRLGVALAF